jgi:hypothetical protein
MAAASAEPDQFRGTTGQGSFVTDADCVHTTTIVFVSEEWNHNPPGAPTSQVYAKVDITQVDSCQNVVIHAISGETNAVSFSADKQLRSGRLTATFVGLTDTATGATVAITAEIRWSGTQDLTVSRNHEVIKTEDGLLNVQTVYRERVGTMTGRVTDGDEEFGGIGFGFLASTDTRSVVVSGT